MPQEPAGSRKRLRTDAVEQDANLDNSTMDAKIPDWAEKSMNKTLQSIANLEKSIYKKELAISKLEEHCSNGTCPRSLQIGLKVLVTEEYQIRMDEMVKSAVSQCQKLIMDGLIKVRSEELALLRKNQEQVGQDWKETTSETLKQMAEAGILTETPTTNMEIYNHIFQELGQKKIREAKMECFLHHKRQLELKEKAEIQHAKHRVDEVLKDQEFINLEQKVDKLQRSIQKLSKNEGAKPSQKQGGGPKNQKGKRVHYPPKTPKTRTHGKIIPKPQNRNSNKSGTGYKNSSPLKRRTVLNKSDIGKGNPKPLTHAKTSTTPSGSGKKNFRKKHD